MIYYCHGNIISSTESMMEFPKTKLGLNVCRPAPGHPYHVVNRFDSNKNCCAFKLFFFYLTLPVSLVNEEKKKLADTSPPHLPLFP